MKIAFLHPDLGIGGAERLVVDAALGLQRLGHTVDVYTSHHDRKHCFEETRDGTLNVVHIKPPFPRSINGKFHIVLAHARQLHLTRFLLGASAPKYDVYFVDQLSTCVPLLRGFTSKRVVFYCHFPDKLLVAGQFANVKQSGLLKRIYRLPMDWLEEKTTGNADVILANSGFTASIFKTHFPSITATPRIVYPGINVESYEVPLDTSDPNLKQVESSQPTFLSLNRFEAKKNAALAIAAFSIFRKNDASNGTKKYRLVLAGGYDPRVTDNVQTLELLVERTTEAGLSYSVITPTSSSQTPPTFTSPSSSSSSPSTTNDPDVLFLLNFTTPQRTALLTGASTLALLYTPANEHFGIVPVEAMLCGLPVLACDSGGPTESVLASPPHPASERTGWLCSPKPDLWANALSEIVSMTEEERLALRDRAKQRAKGTFGMDAMAVRLEEALNEAVAMGKVRSPVPILLIVLYMVTVIPFLIYITPRLMQAPEFLKAGAADID